MPSHPAALHFLALALATALPAVAQLAGRSPFLPPADETTVTEAPSALEFRGYLSDAEGIRFRLTDNNRKTNAWVRLNERNADMNLLAKTHDPAQDTLVVEYDGRTQALTQRKSKIVSAGVAMPRATSNVTAPTAAANVQPNYAYNAARGSFEVSGFAQRQSPAAAPSAADSLQATADRIAASRNARAQAANAAPATVPAPKR